MFRRVYPVAVLAAIVFLAPSPGSADEPKLMSSSAGQAIQLDCPTRASKVETFEITMNIPPLERPLESFIRCFGEVQLEGEGRRGVRVRAVAEFHDEIDFINIDVSGDRTDAEGYFALDLAGLTPNQPRAAFVKLFLAGSKKVDTFVAGCRILDRLPCVADSDTACLLHGRLQVQASWQDSDGTDNPSLVISTTRDTATFYDVDPTHRDLSVRVVDACARDGHFEVRVDDISKFDHLVRATNTETGITRTSPSENQGELYVYYAPCRR